MKYIVVKDVLGLENIILFPSTIEHKDMAVRITGLHSQHLNGIVVSAGQIYYNEEIGTLNCIGESTPLGVRSREKDTGLLKASLRVGNPL